jgi:hypothetical protein
MVMVVMAKISGRKSEFEEEKESVAKREFRAKLDEIALL